jgi:hypothetical protein
MSFWSDASPIVKGAIIFGVLGLLYLGVAAVAGIAPFGSGHGEDTTQTRGIQ